MADRRAIKMMMINLLSNARDASPPGGAIRVSSEVSEMSVVLLVEDEGTGIPQAIMDRLFEPFFTTKDPGQGTGLGLALVYSIVEEHYGQITIDSPADPERQRAAGRRPGASLAHRAPPSPHPLRPGQRPSGDGR